MMIIKNNNNHDDHHNNHDHNDDHHAPVTPALPSPADPTSNPTSSPPPCTPRVAGRELYLFLFVNCIWTKFQFSRDHGMDSGKDRVLAITGSTKQPEPENSFKETEGSTPGVGEAKRSVQKRY